MTTMTKTNITDLLWPVTTFLWAEADLLDRKEYDNWLDLWHPDGFYTLPIGDTTDFANALNLCHDNAKMRRDRVERFKQGFSISSAPPAQTVRSVSRVVVDSAEGDVIKVRSAQQLVENKFGRQRIWAADMEHALEQTDTGFQIRGKVVRLMNSDGMLNSFSYLF